ncbi:MAG TPA: ABC transporter permease [Alphaproteobacteria bacterium]|nr:ABC transporter permease [Alphaproteobacteria bacterium]
MAESTAERRSSVGTSASCRGRPMMLERVARWALAAPALFLIATFFGLPTLYLLRMSFNRHTPDQIFVPDWTFDNYATLLTDPFYVSSIGNTAVLALVTAFVTVVLAYPYSLYVWFGSRRRRFLLLGTALLPLLISEVSIIFGWQIFFPRSGVLSTLLFETGLVGERFSLMFTFTAAVVGITYITLPFAIFILMSVFDGLDRLLLHASSDLGASPFRTFWEVLFPLSRGGITIAASQAFIWAMGTYATPSALGPDWLWTVGFEVHRQMSSWRNWPFASALTAFLVLSILAFIIAIQRGRPTTERYHA